jgi:hypothetical protein
MYNVPWRSRWRVNSYMEDGRPVELTRSFFRGDRYSSVAHSVRKNKSILPARGS